MYFADHTVNSNNEPSEKIFSKIFTANESYHVWHLFIYFKQIVLVKQDK